MSFEEFQDGRHSAIFDIGTEFWISMLAQCLPLSFSSIQLMVLEEMSKMWKLTTDGRRTKYHGITWPWASSRWANKKIFKLFRSICKRWPFRKNKIKLRSSFIQTSLGPYYQCCIPRPWAIVLLVSERKISKCFLPYMGVAAILVMWPRRREQTFVSSAHGGSLWNLALIGPMVSFSGDVWRLCTTDGRRSLAVL